MDERLLRADAIIFDVGNVLLSFDPGKVSMLLPKEHRSALYESMFGPIPRWAQFDLGQRSNEDIAREIAGAAGMENGESMVLSVLRHFHETMEPLPLYHLIGPLKQMGKRLFALTNYPEPSFTLACEAFPGLMELEGRVVSSREKLAKPGKEIFQLLLDRYRVNPETALFIDDVKANVEGAGALQIPTWHYAGMDRL